MTGAQALLKKLDQHQATLAGHAKEPTHICIVSHDEYAKVSNDDNVLYLCDVDLDQFVKAGITPPNTADQGRYLRELGL